MKSINYIKYAFIAVVFSFWGFTSLFAEIEDSVKNGDIKEKPAQETKISDDKDVNEIFKEANELYIAERYSKAEELYQSILNKKVFSPELYFNLGNTYYRLNNIPKALLYYEKAKKYMPQDEDLAFNLGFVNKLTVDKITPKNRLFVFDWIEDIRDTFTSTGWAYFTIFFVWLFFIALGLYYFVKKRALRKISFIGGLISIVIILGTAYMGWRKSALESSNNTAIIFEGRVEVKHSPEQSAKDLVVLHEGTKVEIISEAGGWKKIRLADGNEGWVFKGALEII